MNNSEKRAQLEKFKQVRSLATELQKTPYPFDMFVEIKEAELAKEEEIPGLIEYINGKRGNNDFGHTCTGLFCIEWLSKLTAKIEGMKENLDINNNTTANTLTAARNGICDRIIKLLKP